MLEILKFHKQQHNQSHLYPPGPNFLAQESEILNIGGEDSVMIQDMHLNEESITILSPQQRKA